MSIEGLLDGVRSVFEKVPDPVIQGSSGIIAGVGRKTANVVLKVKRAMRIVFQLSFSNMLITG
ncbi:MAG: hypothetical protein OXH90_01890 [Paracoccaceae bacterium]|nr:hypothetical protein [Paracoccaceae bacterium]MDE2916111.1 hypothetical protein [Paracoccaceae bacterium]